MTKVVKFLSLVGLFAASLWAAPALMEGVAAVVDGKPIMRSEFLNFLYQFQETPEGAAMTEQQQKDYALEQLIDEKVLLSRIDRDSIVVTDAEVEQRVDDQIERIKIGNKARLSAYAAPHGISENEALARLVY